jgi:hypothetical protein
VEPNAVETAEATSERRNGLAPRSPGVEERRRARKGSPRNLGDRAAKLVDAPAGESPAGGDYPVATVVIPGGGEGDRLVESPEVKASEREASHSAGCSKGEPVSLERIDIGSAEPLGSLGEGQRLSRRNWVRAAREHQELWGADRREGC